MRHIYENETDHFSAESAEQANWLQCRMYGMSRDEVDLFEEPPVPDDKTITVTFQDGAENGRDYPAWVDLEPEASLEWVQLRQGRMAKVSASARVWAKHEDGMICSTEF